MLKQHEEMDGLFILTGEDGKSVGTIKLFQTGYYMIEVYGEICPTFVKDKDAADHMAQAMYKEWKATKNYTFPRTKDMYSRLRDYATKQK